MCKINEPIILVCPVFVIAKVKFVSTFLSKLCFLIYMILESYILRSDVEFNLPLYSIFVTA